MKFAHISDLHIGKKVAGFSMLEDQEYILEQIVGIIKQEKVTGVLIAGDIYDKAIPAGEAVNLFDDFLVRLVRLGCRIFMISGNHDSPERIAFAGRILKNSGVYVSPVYQGKPEAVTVEDEYGEIIIHLLPFIKPLQVKHFFPEETISDYTEALAQAIKESQVDPRKRNILLAHQFVTGANRCDSEEVSVGGLDNVDAKVFEAFDYVALGHIHGAQNISAEKAMVRYCGTPLKYSFSEVHHKKSVTILDIKEKGTIEQKEVALLAKRDFLILKGTYEELIHPSYVQGVAADSYMQIILEDEMDVPNAFANLSRVYPNLMQLKYDNKRTREQRALPEWEEGEMQNPLTLFSDFYESRNNEPLTELQANYLKEKMEEIWENT